MIEQSLNALSPLDGRYRGKTKPLCSWLSEAALMRHRVAVEVAWLEALAAAPEFHQLAPLSESSSQYLNRIVEAFSDEDAARIKEIEQTTNHDVKACEYFLKERIQDHTELVEACEFVHFAKTSEDINNVAYSLMLKGALEHVILPEMQQLIATIRNMALQHQATPMLARTHGQPASPTTLGKEFANFTVRCQQAHHDVIACMPLRAKLNGAVGNFNAHYIACPDVDWKGLSQSVIEGLGLSWQKYSSQIEPHDNLATMLHALSRFNNIALDMARDCWGYISLDYFTQEVKAGEVGSSTMPHKVNPIDFENAEGNLGLANANFEHLAAKLQVSRWQRDLSDSTALRALSHGFGHTLLALSSLLKGLSKLKANEQQLAADLDQHWEILGEALQTVMRLHGLPSPYEKIKAASRGKGLSKDDYLALVRELALPDDVKQRLLALTPAGYLGIAAELAGEVS